MNGNASEVSVYSSEQNTHIRSLAASCAACHGTQGNAVGNNIDNNIAESNAVLAGMASADFMAKMLGFRDGSRTSTVMHHHAKGLNLDEINQLAVHFSQQKRMASTSLKSQILKVGHE
jgi:cytochrome c553